jgi:hypothetical protein
MEKLNQQISSLVKEHGLLSIVSALIENFDGEADFANLSGDKKSEDNYRKVAVVLFDAMRKIDGV